MNEFTDLYSDPKWFHCAARAEWIRLDRCIAMQESNARKERSGSSDPFPICVECEQGGWNRHFRGVRTDGIPKRGKGERHTECQLYSACLGTALKNNWRSWNCESCPYYASGIEKTMTVEKPEGKRLCKQCGDKPTFGMSPFCASCMAKRGNAARKKSKKPKSPKGRKKAGHSKDKAEKSPPCGDTAVITIDFGKHAPILRKIESLAEDQIRPIEAQIIFMLKSCLSNSGEMIQLDGG